MPAVIRAVVFFLVVPIGWRGTVGSASSTRADVHIAPTRIVVDSGTSTGSFVVRNTSASPIAFDVRIYAWRHTAVGEIALARTDDAVVFPALIAIGPSESRRVRIGARVPAVGVERTYRVILTQIDPAHAQAGVSMRMRFSVPVFLQPQNRTATVDLAPPSVAGLTLRVRLANRGAVHVTPDRVRAVGMNAVGEHVWSRDLPAWYLLAGESRDHEAVLTLDECRATAAIAVEATFTEGASLTLHERAAVADAACQDR